LPQHQEVGVEITRGSMAKKLPPVGKISILPRIDASAGLNVPSSPLVSPRLLGYALALS
jgi:hypothetical protein